MGLPNEVVQSSEGTEIPAGVAVVKMLFLIDRVVTGSAIWEQAGQNHNSELRA